MLNNIKNKLGNNSEYYKSLNSLTDKYINAIDSSEGNDKESYSVQRKAMISFTNKEYKKTHRKGIVLAHNELDLVDYIKNSYFKKIDGTRLGIGFISDEKARKLQFDTNYPESIINMMLCIMPNDGHTAERHITDYAKHNNPIPITVEIVSEAINIINNYDAVYLDKYVDKNDQHIIKYQFIMFGRLKDNYYFLVWRPSKTAKTLSLYDVSTSKQSWC